MVRLALTVSFLGILFVSSSAMAMPAHQVVEVYSQDFYDGIAITSMKQASGDFTALVSMPSEDRENLGEGIVVARYDVKASGRFGTWEVFGDERRNALPQHRSFDYSGLENRSSHRFQEIIEQHSVRSIAVSALLLWEEYLAESKFLQPEAFGLKSCGVCTSVPNGCSPSWLTPQSCAGSSIIDACNRHDDCYQCGAACDGSTRADCDSQFRQRIFIATGSTWCANVYWFGVRAIGWIFFQDPSARPYMGGDVYSLGIEISACEGQYYHYCTHFYM